MRLVEEKARASSKGDERRPPFRLVKSGRIPIARDSGGQRSPRCAGEVSGEDGKRIRLK